MNAGHHLLDTWHKVHAEYLETLLHRGALIVGNRDGDALTTLAVVEHGDRMRSLAGELDALGASAPLEQLDTLAGLSPAEREVVALLLAYELDPDVAGHLADRFGEPAISPAVVAALFALSATDAADLVEPSGKLRRLALVVEPPSAPAALGRPVRLAERTLQFLRGRGTTDDRLRALLTPIDPVPMPPAHVDVAHNLRDWLASDDRSAGGPRIALIGLAGAGRAAIAAHVSADFGMRLIELSPGRLVERTDRLELARALTRELVLLPAALYVDLSASAIGDPARAGAISELLDAIDGLAFVAADRPDTSRVSLAVDVAGPGRADRVELWQRSLGAAGSEVDVDALGDQFRFGPRDIARVVASARTRADVEHRPLDDRLLREVCRAEAGMGLAALARRVDARVGWDRLVVGDSERTLLRALCDQVRHRGRVYDDWSVGRGSARGLGTSALFTGPPGTGKTLAAEVIATELDLDLFRIDLASVVSKYIGETEKNLRDVFDAAERGGAILFFDEADALFGKRTEVKDSHDRYANIEIDYLLQRMEDHAGVSILATNRKSDLDQAFLRRVRFVVPFPFPRQPARREIWAAELSVGMPTLDLDLDALARLELAGGNIRNVVVNAAFVAAADDTARSAAVTMTHLLRAAAQEYAKLDRLPTRAEFGDWYGEIVG